jgi:hypothetical protein
LESDAATLTVAAPEPAFFEDVVDPYAVVVPYSKYHEVDRPFGFTVPFSVADVVATAVAAPVTAVGAFAVEKVRSEPRAVPAVFDATRRKWYVRPVVRPEIAAETLIAVVPAPALCNAVFVP